MASYWRHTEIGSVLILLDMDRGDQDLYIGTKYIIIEPLL